MSRQPSIQDLHAAIADIEGPESDRKRLPLRWRNFKATLFAWAVVIADGWVFGGFLLAGILAIGFPLLLLVLGSPKDEDSVTWDWPEGAAVGIGACAFFNTVGLLIWSMPKTLDIAVRMMAH